MNVGREIALFARRIAAQATRVAFRKLDPRTLVRNPVMFVTEILAVLTSYLFIGELVSGGADASVVGQIAAWLWFTVLFANFAEAMAEGRGKARAETLRATRTEMMAKRLSDPKSTQVEQVPSQQLRLDDIVLVEAGDLIPADGEVVEGIASVDESAITGESAPVIRESGGDFSGVTGGTRVLSDWIKVRVTQRPGQSFLDRMIALVEGAERKKTPNEVALSILLVGMTLIFLLVVITVDPMQVY